MTLQFHFAHCLMCPISRPLRKMSLPQNPQENLHLDTCCESSKIVLNLALHQDLEQGINSDKAACNCAWRFRFHLSLKVAGHLLHLSRLSTLSTTSTSSIWTSSRTFSLSSWSGTCIETEKSSIINQPGIHQITNYQSTMATNRQLSINNGNSSPIINQHWQQISNFQLAMATNCQFINKWKYRQIVGI